MLGALACALGLAVVFGLARMDVDLVWEYGFVLPRAVGRTRLAEMAAPGALWARLAEVQRAWGLWSCDAPSLGFGVGVGLAARSFRGWRSTMVRIAGPALHYLTLPTAGRGLVAGGLLVLVLARHPALDAFGRACRRSLGLLVVAETLLLVSLVHAVLTNNEPHNSAPFAFVSVGLVLVAALRALPTRVSDLPMGVLTAILLAIVVVDAMSFDRRINLTRRVHRLRQDPRPLFADSPRLPAGLDFLLWRTPAPFALEAEDLWATVDLVRHSGRNFFLLGDTSIVYGLTGRPSVGPSVWFHPGLTFPLPGDPARTRFERALEDSLEQAHVGLVLLENERTFMGTQAADFPPLVTLLRRRACRQQQIGPFTIVELSEHGTGVGGPGGPDRAGGSASTRPCPSHGSRPRTRSAARGYW
jgi:hypothetical protein